MASRAAVFQSGIIKRGRAIVVVTAVAAVAFLALPSFAAAATKTWTGGTNTHWGTASNWSPSGVPGPTDDVVINNTASTNPVVDAGGADSTCATPCQAASVTLSGSKTLTIAAAELDVSGAVSAPAGTNVTVNGTGTFKFGTLTVDNAAGLTLTSGTIAGTLAASAATTILNTGVNYGSATTDTTSLGSNVTLHQTTNTVTLEGTLAIGSDTYNLDGQGINASATGNPLITIGSSGQLQNNGSADDTVQPRIDSSGTIVDDSTSGGLRLTNSVTTGSPAPNQYGGAITESDASGGCSVLELGGNTAGSGGQVKSGGVTINNDVHNGGGGCGKVAIVTTTTAGDFDVNGQTVTMNGDLTYDGKNQDTHTVKGGSGSTFQSGSCAPSNCVGALNINHGDFGTSAKITIPSGTNAYIVTNDSAWNNNFTFDVAGTLTLVGHSITTTAVPASAPTILVTGTLDHSGSTGGLVEPVVQSTGTVADSSTGGNGLVLQNPNGINTDQLSGLLQTRASTAQIQLGASTNSEPTVFQLTGNLTTDTFSGGTSNCSGGGGTIETAGTNPDLQLAGHTVTIDGVFTHAAGTISGSSGTINGPGSVTCNGVSTSATPGSLKLAGGNLAPGGPMTINAPVDQQTSGTGNTTLEGAGASVIVNNTWTTDHNINYAGTSGTNMVINGTLHFLGGSGQSANIPLQVNGTLTEDANSSGVVWEIDSSNGGTCTPVASCLTTVASNATVNDNTGTMKIDHLSNVGGNSPTNTLTGGTWNVGNAGILELPTAGTDGVDELAATLSITGGGALKDTGGNASLADFGTIDSGATLTFTNHSETVGDQTVDGTLVLDGTSNITSGTTTVDSSGVLKGAGGTLTGDVDNSGIVHPGDSPGQLSITGNYTQESGGNLNIEINGTSIGQYGLLHIGGNATLAGTLNVLPSASYAASAATGDDIAFGLYFGTQTGSFSTVTVNPPLNNGRQVTVDLTEPGEIEAVVGAPNISVPQIISNPTISPSGSPTPGTLLSTTNGAWTDSPTFTYQWYDCDSAGNACSQIGGQLGSTYTVTTTDVGHTIRSVVFASNSAGAGAAESAATGVVPPVVTPVVVTPKPKVSGASLSSTSFKAKKGTTLKLTLSSRATVRVVISRTGHKVNGTCSAKAKTGKKCTIKVKTLTFSGVAGANSFKLKLKGLKKGSYTAVITAKSSAGTSGKTTLTFKIK